MFRITQPCWILRRFHEQLGMIPDPQFSKCTRSFLRVMHAGKPFYLPNISPQVRVQKASTTNRAEELGAKTKSYNLFHFLTAGIGLSIGSSSKILTASCETITEGEGIQLKPWDERDLATLLPKSYQRQRIIQDLKARKGTLYIEKGLSEQEIGGLADWLRTHCHGFMHLKVDKEYLSDPSKTDALKEIKGELRRNKEAFRDRASPEECAAFCVLAYKNREEIAASPNLPKDWNVLASSDQFEKKSSENGYFGVAFVNHKTGNIVIAHRGTEFPEFSSTNGKSENISEWLKKGKDFLEFGKDLRADYSEVACLSLGGQQKSAMDFSRKVHTEAQKYKYRTGCVGHSLGGWLAQVIAYILNDNQVGKTSTYVVCLDSPGANEMITKHYRLKYRMGEETPLDVTNYVLFPNHVNCFGKHLGTLYQLSPNQENFDLEKRSGFEYLLATHSKDTLFGTVKTFETSGVGYFVENWPAIDSCAISDLLSQCTGVNAVKNLLPTVWGSKSWLEVFGKLCKTVVEKGAEGYQTYTLATIQYDNYRNQISTTFHDYYDMVYRAGFRVKAFDRKAMRVCHLTKETRGLLLDIQKLRELGGNEKQMRAFLENKALELDISPSELLPFLGCKIEEGLLIVGSGEKTATEIRRRACQLLNCFPKELKESLTPSAYLKFLNDWPEQRVKDILADPFISPPTTAYYFKDGRQDKETTATKLIDQKFQQTDVVYLYGVTGSGKSEIARQYYDFFKHKNSPDETNFAFFIDASSPEKLEQGWNQISLGPTSTGEETSKSANGQSQPITEVYKALESWNRNYLIVFNGVEQLSNVKDYLPPNFLDKKSTGKILITTTSEASIESHSAIDVANQFPIELLHANEILTRNGEVDLEVRTLFNHLWDGSDDLEHDNESMSIWGKAINFCKNFFFNDSKRKKETPVATSLKTSPLALDLVSRYLQNSSSTERQAFVKLLQKEPELEKILSSTIQAIVKTIEKDKLTSFLLNTLSFIPHDLVSKEVIEKWATSKKACSVLSKEPGEDQLKSSIQTLEKYGILQAMTEEKKDFFYIHPYVYQEIKKHLSDKPSWLSMKESPIDLFFQFLSDNMSLDNRNKEDSKRNKNLRPYAEFLLTPPNDQTLSKKEKGFKLKVINLLNAVANSYYLEDSFTQSFKTFQQSKKMCEEHGEIRYEELLELSEEAKEKSLNILSGKNPELANALATTLHYLGKIHFQNGERKSALEHFSTSKEIRASLIKNNEDYIKNEDNLINWILVRRQGEGWCLLESNDPKDWSKAKELYLQLLEEKKDDSFNSYYCNLELSRIYCKFAQAEERGKTDIKAAYYTKAIERLRDGGNEEGIPFQGALMVLRLDKKNKYIEAETETLLEIAKVLSDRDNPSYDYRKAEEILLNLLDENLKAIEPDKRKDYPLRIYHRLAMLYKAQVRSYLRDEDSERNAKRAKRYAEMALQELGFFNRKELVGIAKRREKEIKELEELLT